jgi:hypothetical protein
MRWPTPFHFTNACLQLDEFNQRSPVGRVYEQFLLERKAKERQNAADSHHGADLQGE